MEKKRTLDDVKREYSQACMQLGDIKYKIVALEIAARELEKGMRHLNKEATRLQSKEAANGTEPAAE